MIYICIDLTLREIQSIFPYPVRMQENADQNNSEYGRFSRSGSVVPVQSSFLNINTLRETCLYSELFWSEFSRIRTEYEPE